MLQAHKVRGVRIELVGTECVYGKGGVTVVFMRHCPLLVGVAQSVARGRYQGAVGHWS